MSDDLFTRYRRVRAEVDAAAHAAGRTPEEVFLLPVSKTVPAPVIRELYEHGLRDFGENRVPVLEEKAGILPEDIRWHFIGQLQSNKVRKVVKIASVIHSVDSAALTASEPNGIAVRTIAAAMSITTILPIFIRI